MATGAPKAFHERAERGRDEERLNADIALADCGEYGANIIAAPRDLREVVEPYRGDDDVADDEEAESGALRSREGSESEGHVEAESSDDDRDGERADGTPVSGDLEDAEHDEEDREGEERR